MAEFIRDPQSPEEEQEQPINVKGKEDDEQRQQQQNRETQKCLCDFCGELRALIYCRADTAKLCISCDHDVHSGNPLFGKHSRSQLCDACASNPASIYCSTENLVLCQNCDWDSHGGSSSTLHDRRPLEGFSGCPSAIELSSILGFEDVGYKSLLLREDDPEGNSFVSVHYGSMGDKLTDDLAWDTSVVSLDNLIVSTNLSQNFQAIGIPPPPKNRKTACGKHKEEMLHQLCKLAKLESLSSMNIEPGEIESLLGLETPILEQNLQSGYMHTGIEHNTGITLLSGYDASVLQWHGDCGEPADQVPISLTYSENHLEESLLVLGKPTEDCGTVSHANAGYKEQSQCPIVTESLPILARTFQHELTRIDRGSVISRYKEKKKARRYDKHIRYESRKVRAESRTRIKGRFAKINI
uniref:Zinc finger protein CONSTANS-LIKE 13 n=1 Tax=Nelumbo nucifera TaxID=4432 RepID=A0A822YGW7_NELNU|nr:TPA_asm: hypothetical protein HUJ06_012285 [Nelumbo nucifera]